jgi:hypothetical protein
LIFIRILYQILRSTNKESCSIFHSLQFHILFEIFQARKAYLSIESIQVSHCLFEPMAASPTTDCYHGQRAQLLLSLYRTPCDSLPHAAHWAPFTVCSRASPPGSLHYRSPPPPLSPLLVVHKLEPISLSLFRSSPPALFFAARPPHELPTGDYPTSIDSVGVPPPPLLPMKAASVRFPSLYWFSV